jgi:hypothetical protein
MHIPANLSAMSSLFCLTGLASPDILLPAIYFILGSSMSQDASVCVTWIQFPTAETQIFLYHCMQTVVLAHTVYLIFIMGCLHEAVKMVLE